MFYSQNKNESIGERSTKSVKRLNKIVLAFSLLISVSGTTVYSQKVDSKPSPPQQERKIGEGRTKTPPTRENPDLELEKRFAQDLLETVAGRAKALDNSILKVKVVARV